MHVVLNVPYSNIGQGRQGGYKTRNGMERNGTWNGKGTGTGN